MNHSRKKLQRLIVCSILCILFICLFVIVVLVNIAWIYESTPELEHLPITMTLGAFNAVPVLIALFKIIKYAFLIKNNNDNYAVLCTLKLLPDLKRVFFVQAIYTPFSVIFVGMIENVGPPFYLIASFFITSISLVLASLFDVLSLTMSVINNNA